MTVGSAASSSTAGDALAITGSGASVAQAAASTASTDHQSALHGALGSFLPVNMAVQFRWLGIHEDAPNSVLGLAIQDIT
jgi:hypothetical protein